MTFTLIDDRGGRKQLEGRVAEFVAWLVDKAEQIEQAEKGSIRADFAGDNMTFRLEQIECKRCGRR